jgi:hypothetical protein
VKKILIPIVAASIAATGAYLYQKQTPSYNVLKDIPANTPLFVGSLEPMPLKDNLITAAKYSNPNDIEKLESLYAIPENDSPAIQFFFSLLKEYHEGLATPELLLKKFGLADNVRGYFYTLGLLPVLKIEVENPQAIWDLLDRKELETGFSHEQRTIKENPFRLYRLTAPNDDNQIDLIIAQANGILTVTLSAEFVPDDLIASALGIDKPTVSLADSNTLDNIVKQHKFSEEMIGFINHVAIVDAITGTEDSILAKHLTTLMDKNNNQAFKSIQNPICQQEFGTIAQNWPRSAFGYTKMDMTKDQSTFDFSFVIESKNKVILDALKSLRGFIPSYVKDSDNTAASASVGLDVGNLASALTSIWDDLQTPTFQCAPLASIQSNISESGQSIGMVGMSTNMAAGVKGLSAALFDYNISKEADTQEPQLTSLDALIALHADNPEAIFNSIKLFIPQLQQVQLTNNGPEISLDTLYPIDPALNIAPKLAIKGNHLMIYNGDKAKQEADKLADEKLVKNGLYQASYNTLKIFAPLKETFENSDDINIPQELSVLFDYDITMGISLDVNDQGIYYDTKLTTKPLEK